MDDESPSNPNLFLVVGLLIACTGTNGLRGTPPDGAPALGGAGAGGGSMVGVVTGGTSGNGGGVAASGGQGGLGGADSDASGTGDTSLHPEAAMPDSPPQASPDAACDLRFLEGQLSYRLGPLPGQCFLSTSSDPRWGYLVFGSDGQLIDDTGFCCTGPAGPDKQTWLDGLANVRWPCLASQTIPYYCSQGD
jgi:hypothetical protein